ncbi:hypothetical protein FKW77_004116 [Venturia effusa]|uniref:Mid2 domain-containing protein n=1 Tax=Venturia effusa TaxID=50376 RepID=A0A517LAU2_9PEZI|nr:hypothetical protein FKW77_004116 [Venturia effusa]
MATTTALTSVTTSSTTAAIDSTTSSTLSSTTSLFSTVTTDVTLTSTALISQSQSTSILSATTTFSAGTTFDAGTTSAFSTASTALVNSPVVNSQSASAPSSASSSAATLLNSASTNLKPTTIAGIAIGAAGLLLLIIFLSLCICLTRRRKMRSSPPQITFLPRSPSRASDEENLEKGTASSQAQEIESIEEEIRPKAQSMGGSTLLAVPHANPTVERFSWKAQTAEHLNVTPPVETRPFSWMKQDQEQYPTADDNISPDTVQWRPASELLGQAPPRNGSPFSLPPHMIRAPPSQDSLHSSLVPSHANRQSYQSDTVLRNQIKQAFHNGARQSYVSSPLSDPTAPRWRGSEMGSIIDENMEVNSRFSGETLGKLRSEHARIQTERSRISRLQQLDEEEDWIKQQIANVETKRASAMSRAF